MPSPPPGISAALSSSPCTHTFSPQISHKHCGAPSFTDAGAMAVKEEKGGRKRDGFIMSSDCEFPRGGGDDIVSSSEEEEEDKDEVEEDDGFDSDISDNEVGESNRD